METRPEYGGCGRSTAQLIEMRQRYAAATPEEQMEMRRKLAAERADREETSGDIIRIEI